MERGPNWSMGGGKLLRVQLNVENLCVDRGIESSYKGMKKRSQEKLPRDQANSLCGGLHHSCITSAHYLLNNHRALFSLTNTL